MRKMDYGKIKWNATTNWEFCGSKENLKEVWNRARECRGVRTSVEEFGYSKPSPGLAFEKGDVVVYVDDEITSFAVVDAPLSDNGYFYIRLPDGHQVQVHPRELAVKVKIADVYPTSSWRSRGRRRAKPLDLSKCPLKKAGACMKGDKT